MKKMKIKILKKYLNNMNLIKNKVIKNKNYMVFNKQFL